MPHTSSSELKSNGLGRFIRARTISDAWHRGLNLIWRQGEEMVDERGFVSWSFYPCRWWCKIHIKR